MKKAKILKLPEIRHGRGKNASAVIVTIDNVKHLIIDIHGDALYRMAYTENEFAHYDYGTQQWDKRQKYNNYHWTQIERAVFSNKSFKAIKEFYGPAGKRILDDEADYIYALENRIDSAKTEKERIKKQTEMEKLMAAVPPEPDYLKKKIKEYADKSNVILYKRHGTKAEYRCCQCGGIYEKRIKACIDYPTYPVHETPHRGNFEKCCLCGCTGQLVQSGRAKNTCTIFNALVYQTLPDGTLIARGYQTWISRYTDTQMSIKTREVLRQFFRRNFFKSYENTGGEREHWLPYANEYPFDASFNFENAIFSSDLRYFPAREFRLLETNYYSDTKALKELETYANCPQIESVIKAELTTIARQIYFKSGHIREFNKKADRLTDFLCISKNEYNWLIKDKSDAYSRLKTLKCAERNNVPLKNIETLHKLKRCMNYMWKKDTEVPLKYQSIVRLWNYLEKARNEYSGSIPNTLTEYSDYIRARAARGDDLTNEVYLHPKSLRQKWSELRQQEEKLKNKTYITDMLKKYPDIPKVCRRIEKKYTWQQSDYIIRPAHNAEEIVLEGKTLHHCVGSDNQRYMSNYNAGKAYILVLRKTREPQIPYITVEISGDKVMQWYGQNDTKPDYELIEKFLKDYTEYLNRKERVRIA